MSHVIHDQQRFLDLTEALLSQGYGVRFRAFGTSMRPTIENGDAVTIVPAHPTEVRPGDVVLYRFGHRLIAHRVVDICRSGEAIVAFVLRGDGTTEPDTPVAPHQVLGRLLAIERDDRPRWHVWFAKLSHVWRQIRLSARVR